MAKKKEKYLTTRIRQNITEKDRDINWLNQRRKTGLCLIVGSIIGIIVFKKLGENDLIFLSNRRLGSGDVAMKEKEKLCEFCHKNKAENPIYEEKTEKEVWICIQCENNMQWDESDNTPLKIIKVMGIRNE